MSIEQDYYERYTALCSEVWRGWHAVNIMNCLIDLQNDKELVTNDNRNPIINYLLDSNERWMYYSANITVQPASSYALKHIISFSDLGLSFFIWIFLELLMYVVVGYRNKNYV